jgi:RNA polymerase sigma-70 factor (ECF subfamily)
VSTQAFCSPPTRGVPRDKVDAWLASEICRSDEELMARLQEGDTSAFDPLVPRYSRLIYRIAFRILHDHGEADEIVQDVFFYLFERANLFDPAKGTAKAWIMQITHHRALDKRAYLSRRAFYKSTDVTHLDEVMSWESNLDQVLGASHDLNRLQAAFNELSSKQQRTLDLYYFEELDLREIAEKLNESLGNVRHHLYRGLHRLRRHTSVQQIKDRRTVDPQSVAPSTNLTIGVGIHI